LKPTKGFFDTIINWVQHENQLDFHAGESKPLEINWSYSSLFVIAATPKFLLLLLLLFVIAASPKASVW
jgi:hypothetical protein